MNFKNIKRSLCGKCNKKPISGQPLVRCKECKLKFCLDHAWSGQYCKGRTKPNEELGAICDICKEKFGYVSFEEEMRSTEDTTDPSGH